LPALWRWLAVRRYEATLSVGAEDHGLALGVAARMSEVLRSLADQPFLFEDALAAYRQSPGAPKLPSARALVFFDHLAALGIVEPMPTKVVYPGGKVKELLRLAVLDEPAVLNLERVLRQRLVRTQP
jgi:hypothetical protein